MAEVDIVADAHQVHVVLPNVANNPVSAPTNRTAPYMGGEPMQISALRNNSKYGRKKQPRMQNGPRQGRNNNNNGPSSAYPNRDVSGMSCFNCGKRGHLANQCTRRRHVRVSREHR